MVAISCSGLHCATGSIHYFQNNAYENADYCRTARREIHEQFDEFVSNTGLIETKIRLRWAEVRYWFFFFFPTFGLLRDKHLYPLTFQITNRRSSAISLSKCEIYFYADSEVKTDSTRMSKLPGCQTNQTIVINPGGTSTFEEEYAQMDANVSEIKNVQVKFRDQQTQQEILQALEIRQDWSWCLFNVN
jgi:hypothetical protein